MANNEDNVSATSGIKSPHNAAVDSSSDVESENDDDYTSSSGSSSEDEQQTSPAHGLQANMRSKASRNNELRTRLTSFLTGIEQANRELDDNERVRAQRIDDVDENEDHYIEMNLGLGVLSAQNPDKSDVCFSRDDDDDACEVSFMEAKVGKDTQDTSTRLRPMPELTTNSKPKIEEINDKDQ